MNELRKNGELKGGELIKDMCKNWKQYASPEYMDFSRECSEKSINTMISNEALPHAILLTTLLMNRAKESIKIYSGSFNEVFYDCDDIMKSFKNAIEKNKKLKIDILLKEIPDDFPRRFKELWHNNKDRINISKAAPDLELDRHFLLSDDIAYRFEKPHSKEIFKDDYKVEATANFGDKKFGEFLGSNVFSSISENQEKKNINMRRVKDKKEYLVT